MKHYIGFADSEKFLEAVERERQINLDVSRKAGRPDRRFGIAVDCTVLTLSQVQGDEVLYFQHVTHRYQTNGGQVMDLDETKHVRLARQVLEITQEYLNEQGVSWRQALLAMPRNYTTLDGDATFLRYDKESQSYLRRQPDPA